MDTREVLRPYKKKRLGFEGVLIDIYEPNRRNSYTYGLIFASVYASNEGIELDHAVIQMSVAEFKKAQMNLYTRYYFTAAIASYYKTVNIMGIIAQRESFMLQNISLHKLREVHTSQLEQPTEYVKKRIETISLCKVGLAHTKEELITMVTNIPNDGSVERFINQYTESYQQVHVNKRDLMETLYA
ncbi:hypothetical protein HXA34_19950 [Salipaludibacillus agaradhaerens]|jgi:hypothetical protein|uniref:40S ribosomal protein S21 n=1 Tax=Salipaludibacillus agaradhaerens TaxID=76935 RepID=UPI002150B536|nr:40S ribosomal protein S21 [Salipaludibacillus agaradhaerens]MCR6108564.1 hypothetical protein [Salipaludibacillus agaradhaerens]MCR6120593.1 hypothetical protein [Salipaludibacillus agaradhaerens]